MTRRSRSLLVAVALAASGCFTYGATGETRARSLSSANDQRAPAPPPASLPDVVCTTKADCDYGELCSRGGICYPEGQPPPSGRSNRAPQQPAVQGCCGISSGAPAMQPCTTSADCGNDQRCMSGICQVGM